MAGSKPINRVKGRDGDVPSSGGIQVIPICFSNLLTNTAYGHTVDLPAGMSMRIIDINVQAIGITTVITVQAGTTKAGTEIAAAAALTTNLGSLTLKGTNDDDEVAIAAGGLFEIRVITDAGAILEGAIASVTAYVSSPPNSMAVRNSSHY